MCRERHVETVMCNLVVTRAQQLSKVEPVKLAEHPSMPVWKGQKYSAPKIFPDMSCITLLQRLRIICRALA